MPMLRNNPLTRLLFARKRSSKRACRSLSFEACERRNLMAGNITATLVGTTLNIVGDGGANVVFITKPTSTRVTVSGQATTVNGTSTPSNFTGVLNLNINLGAGNDAVVIARTAATALNFYNAPDLINYAFSTRIDAGPAMFGNVSAEGGSGDDKNLYADVSFWRCHSVGFGRLDNVALIGSTVRGLYSVNSGAGADFVITAGTRVLSSVTYSLGSGDDYSYNEVVFAGAWSVDLGPGVNAIEFFGANPTGATSALQSLTVTGNTGSDTVTIQGSRFKSISIDLGGGNDVLSWWGAVQTTGSVLVQGGDGNDQINIDEFPDSRATRIGGDLTINAGTGINTVRVGRIKQDGDSHFCDGLDHDQWRITGRYG